MVFCIVRYPGFEPSLNPFGVIVPPLRLFSCVVFGSAVQILHIPHAPHLSFCGPLVWLHLLYFFLSPQLPNAWLPCGASICPPEPDARPDLRHTGCINAAHAHSMVLKRCAVAKWDDAQICRHCRHVDVQMHQRCPEQASSFSLDAHGDACH